MWNLAFYCWIAELILLQLNVFSYIIFSDVAVYYLWTVFWVVVSGDKASIISSLISPLLSHNFIITNHQINISLHFHIVKSMHCLSTIISNNSVKHRSLLFAATHNKTLRMRFNISRHYFLPFSCIFS